jgi:hypothetical protein
MTAGRLTGGGEGLSRARGLALTAWLFAAWLHFALGMAAFPASAADELTADAPSLSDVPSDQPPAAKEAPQPVQKSVCRTFRVRPEDEVWVVSTRHLGCATDGPLPSLQFWRYENAWWQPATADEFFAGDAVEAVTSFYIHGNQIDHPQACRDGLTVYFQLAGKFDHEPPVRFVIWSWPSSKIKGPLVDVRTKAARSDSEARYLARFLQQFPGEAQVGLVGYSFGARIVSGAMHRIGSESLVSADAEPSRYRVALWAAAEHSDWYMPGRYHDQALAAADAWFITVNSCDPVLARYRLLEKCGDPSAVGYAGIYGRNLLPPDVSSRLEVVNVSHIIGKTHLMPPYVFSLWIQDRTREYVLWHPLGGQPLAKRPQAEAAELAAN